MVSRHQQTLNTDAQQTRETLVVLQQHCRTVGEELTEVRRQVEALRTQLALVRRESEPGYRTEPEPDVVGASRTSV
jgi:hypothetical protein